MPAYSGYLSRSRACPPFLRRPSTMERNLGFLFFYLEPASRWVRHGAPLHFAIEARIYWLCSLAGAIPNKQIHAHRFRQAYRRRNREMGQGDPGRQHQAAGMKSRPVLARRYSADRTRGAGKQPASLRCCDTRLARRIGAELAITGTVQKVSNNSTEPAPSVAHPTESAYRGKAKIVRGCVGDLAPRQ